jgi:hypothetical protein
MKLTVALIAATLLPNLAAQTPTPDALLRWMDKIAQQELGGREKAIAAIHTVAQAERRKQWVRSGILQAIGGLPAYDGPLHAKVTGSIQADGYVIEKVMYQSLPDYYVTANLYRPSRPGDIPRYFSSRVIPRKARPSRNCWRLTWR